MRRLHVLAVASEIFPLIKTGGLADVVGALPPGARARKHRDAHAHPRLSGGARRRSATPRVAHTFAQLHGGPARLLVARAAGLDLFVLDAPHLYARPGNIRTSAPTDNEWPDNGLRFAALAAAAAAIARGAVAGYAPDIVHAHDWQAGLVPALLHYRRSAAAGHDHARCTTCRSRASFRATSWRGSDCRPTSYTLDGVEYHGTIGYLKAGLALADRITTVSPTYAAEIRTPEDGMGLDGLLRKRAQRADRHTQRHRRQRCGIRRPMPTSPARFDAQAPLAPRREQGEPAGAVRTRRRSAATVLGVVSRLTSQKGMDLLLDALPAITAAGVQLALIGSGDKPLESRFACGRQRVIRGASASIIGYDESVAHLVQGGADALLVPSRFEPCGLTQLCALRYGAIPIVARVGGLADTVIDANEMALAAGAGTGIQFAPVTRGNLELAIGRAVALRRD